MKSYQALQRNHYQTTGLALGGGAILGAAHIGVLKAIEERQIHINYISGTSIGALIAALYAFGKSAEEIEALALSLSWSHISSFKLSKLSLFSNQKLGDLISANLGDVNIEDANIPLHIICTDISSGKKVCLSKGNLAQAVMASSCMPGIYVPVTIEGQLLVDGGLVENVPISPLAAIPGNTPLNIIAVDLSANRAYQTPQDIFDIMSNAIDIAIDQHTASQVRSAEIVIKPDLTAKSRTDTNREEIQTIVTLGYEAACAAFDAPLNRVGLLQKLRRKLFRIMSKLLAPRPD